MTIKISPPAISILFSKKCPNLLPIKVPRKDNRKVTIPIIIAGVTIKIFINAKLKMIKAKNSDS